MDTTPVVRVLKGAPDEDELAAVAVALLFLARGWGEVGTQPSRPEGPEWAPNPRHRPAGDWTSQTNLGWST